MEWDTGLRSMSLWDLNPGCVCITLAPASLFSKTRYVTLSSPAWKLKWLIATVNNPTVNEYSIHRTNRCNIPQAWNSKTQLSRLYPHYYQLTFTMVPCFQWVVHSDFEWWIVTISMTNKDIGRGRDLNPGLSCQSPLKSLCASAGFYDSSKSKRDLISIIDNPMYRLGLLPMSCRHMEP